MKKSQGKRILNYLRNGNKLTRLTALNLFKCFELSSRIGELEYQGHTIKRKFVVRNKKHIMLYWMGRY